MLQVLVGGQEDLEAASLGASQQIAVPEAGPPLLLDRPDVMVANLACQPPRKLLVKQDAH